MLSIRAEPMAVLVTATEECFRRALIAEQTAAILTTPELDVPPPTGTNCLPA